MEHFRKRSCFRFFTTFSLLFSLFVVTACTPQQDPVLRIGSNLWPGYEPLYLARSLGYYEKSQIKLVEMSSASDVIHALRNGVLEGAALTLDEVLTLIDDGFKFKVILVMDYSDGGDVLLAKPSITTIKQLRGKNVAVEYTAVGAILLDAALQSAGLNASDIVITDCSVNKHIECFKQADAVVTFEPVSSKLLKQGAVKLFDSRKIPHKIVDVLVVREDAMLSHAQSIQQLLSGYFSARNYLNKNPADASKRMAVRMDLKPDEALATFNGLYLPNLADNWSLLKGQPAPLQLTANQLTQFMYKKKFLRNDFVPTALTDDRFLPDSQ